MKIFLDTDVILDCVLDRPEFAEEATKVLNLCEIGGVEGITSTLVLANCHYVFSRQESAAKSRQVIARLRALLGVCPVGDRELGEALVSKFKDLEDGIQYFTALNNGAHVIVTRNIRDFKSSSLPVMLPREFLLAHSRI
ncbi:MAG: PIN domain-containing protein [Verrucomicrobia bacterium]|nr:PIN domain-containing protein [Verrucomicrobiota bacterium]MCH8526153.1 PIN domain-containing protein [Kiritimatiellia bacterium]